MNLRDLFVKNPDLIYLNTGSLSRCPLPVLEKVMVEIRTAEANPTRHLFSAWERLWQAQLALARMLGARPEDLYLRPNVTFAMNDFVMNVPLPKDGEILISDMEYGAIVNLCRRRAEISGLQLRQFSIPYGEEEAASLTPQQLRDHVIGQIGPQTRLLMVSHILTGNGLILPIDEIGAHCRTHQIVFAVDGAHGPGFLDLNFQNLDFYGGNVHKWQMGPKGTGFGWVAPRWQEQLFPQHIGWTTFEAPGLFQSFGGGHPFATRFLNSSTLEFAPYMALTALEFFWQEYGNDVRHRLQELKLQTQEMIEQLGWSLLSPRHEKLAGPLFTVRLPDRLAAEGFALMDRLERDFGLVISTPPIKGRHELRLSPHVYNSDEDLEKALNILRKL